MLTDVYKPTVGVAALILFKNNILLLKDKKWKYKYVLPGGHVKWGELTKKALIREIKEETHLKIKKASIRLVEVHENIFSKEYYKREHFISFEYACKAVNNNVIISDEHVDYLWIGIRLALKLKLDKFTRKTIKIYLEKYGGNKNVKNKHHMRRHRR